ncbi:hypothetical protein [Streptomyces sp. MB09-02B]|uniref:hypothetical protein n=1 Tax=Streptomyces sp. MB09-02B TaxID=3028667 RepID=UPI0029C02498|nr:hypothetical protein [Streptomyces sp. MB09-02B]
MTTSPPNPLRRPRIRRAGARQDRRNGVTPPTGRLPVWLLGSSDYSAQLAARLGQDW